MTRTQQPSRRGPCRTRTLWALALGVLFACTSLALLLAPGSPADRPQRVSLADVAGARLPPSPSTAPTAPVTVTIYLPLVMSPGRLDPDDPRYVAGYQWGLEKVMAPLAWRHGQANGIVVAIVDSGVELLHPDLSAVLWANPGEIAANGQDDDGNGFVDDVQGWDFIAGDAVPGDEDGHGTHVAGIVGASTNNALGVASLGWGATVMPVRVLDDRGEGTVAQVSQGIYYAADNGARIINLSLGGYGLPPGTALQLAVAYAQSKGVLVVAAAGNDGCSELACGPFYPAGYSGVVGVAATDSADNRAAFSNYGSYVDVAAPGVSIDSTLHAPYYYGTKSGTSMAAPMVSGLAALVWTVDPTAPWSEVASVIMDTADDLGTPGWDQYYGWGRINAAAAVLYGRVLVEPDLALAEQPAHASPPTGPAARFRTGELVVVLRTTLSEAGLGGADTSPVPGVPGVYLVRVPVGQELEVARELARREGVRAAHPNYLLVAAGGSRAD